MTQVPQGVKISSYIFYAFAVFAVLGLCASVVTNGMTLANAGGSEEVMTSAGVSLGIGACISILVAALYGFVGYSLARLQSWARIVAIILISPQSYRHASSATTSPATSIAGCAAKYSANRKKSGTPAEPA
jgi:hypothetical protein